MRSPERLETVRVSGGGPTVAEVQELLDRSVADLVASHGGSIEVVGVEGDCVTVRMLGACKGCHLSKQTLRRGIEPAVCDAFRGIRRVTVVQQTPIASIRNFLGRR